MQDSAQPHVITGTETWLTKDMNSSDFFSNEYAVYTRDKPNNPHGGVLIAVIQTLTSSAVVTGNNTEFLSLKINLKRIKSTSRIICAAYRPPSRTDDEYTNSLINDITSVRSAHNNAYFLLGEDFNLPDLEWPHRCIVARTIPASVTDKFCQMQDDLSLEQLVSFPTRGKKTLDLVFTTHPSLVDKCKPLPSVGQGDHDILLVDLCISPTIAKTQQRKN